MNAVFLVIMLLAGGLFLLGDPEGFLAAMLEGGQKAAVLSLSLLSLYCVWLGFFRVLEASGLARKLTAFSAPILKRLFRSEDEEALSHAGNNLTANLLGLPGAPTPEGIAAVDRFLAEGNDFAADLLFVLGATSLQLLPTTVISLRLAAGSSAPSDIFLPTLLATAASSLLGVLFVFLARKLLRKRAVP